MTLLITLFFLFPGTPGTFQAQVNDAAQAGKISLRDRAHILERAVKDPESLPDKWRALLHKFPLAPSEATGILVDMFQLRQTKGLKEDYPGFPAELPFYVDSSTYPLRVYYESEAYAQNAQFTLESAEYAWEKEVDEWGFYAPPIVTPEGRFRIYLTDSGMGGGGYCAPVETYPDTDWDDCVTYIVIDKSNDAGSIPSVVAHEFNHATQGAMDCLEPSSFWENTATYMMLAVYPEAIYYVQYFLPDFQAYNHWSISDGDYNSYYYYGGFIWPLYLAEVFGGDFHDATIIREMWEASMQSSGFSWNSPDYLEGIDTVLQEYASASVLDAFHGFSRARYFVGSQYMSEHSAIPHSDLYSDYVTVVLNTSVDTEESFTPPTARAPEPWGVNYIEVSVPSGYDRATTIEVTPLQGDDPWAVQLVSLENDQVSLHESDSGTVSLEMNPGDYGDFLVVIEHLAGSMFDVNSGVTVGTQYTFSMRPTIPFPVVSIVTPGEVYTHMTYDVIVRGSGFQEGLELSMFPADQIVVNSAEVIDENQISVNITLSGEVMTGPYSITVTNPDGGSHTLEEALVVTANPNPPSNGDSSWWSCSASRHGSGSSAALFSLLVLLGLWCVRRMRFA